MALTLSVAALGATATAPASAATAEPLKIGTYNIMAGVSTATFARVVNEVLPSGDVFGLQEVNGRDKEDALAALRSKGWSYYRGRGGDGAQNPVIWKSATFSLVSSRMVTTFAGTTHRGSEGPPLGAHAATVVTLNAVATGEDITIVNAHIPPGAIKNGRPNPAKPLTYDRYVRELDATLSLVKAESTAGGQARRVFATGDYNAAYKADLKYGNSRMPVQAFRGIGMQSMWATEVPLGTTRGTHESSLIDHVWTTQKATRAQVLFDVTGSDHFPAVATYSAS
jgi:endonuclease/exonuclease/phosphatase family metal-dependent hydrolase